MVTAREGIRGYCFLLFQHFLRMYALAVCQQTEAYVVCFCWFSCLCLCSCVAEQCSQSICDSWASRMFEWCLQVPVGMKFLESAFIFCVCAVLFRNSVPRAYVRADLGVHLNFVLQVPVMITFLKSVYLFCVCAVVLRNSVLTSICESIARWIFECFL